MIDLNKKKKTKKLIYSKVTILVLLLFLGFFINNIWNFNSKVVESENRKNITEKEYQELIERKAFLDEELERLGSKVGQEEELRTRFSLSKEGEMLVVILDKEETESNATSSDQTAGLFGFFRGLFGGN